MIVAIFANFTKPQAKVLAIEVGSYLQQKGIHVVAADDQARELNLPPLATVAYLDIDLIISFGGDGSILGVVQNYPHLEAPIMGVNLGTLGFLADISPANLYESLEQVLEGKYNVQDRQMLSACKGGEYTYLAVNDVVVHRGKNHTLVDVSLSVDGIHLNTFSADGVIVATPSGSTAYSLSAGGPIVAPTLDAIVITPICPHAITNRPIVLEIPKDIEVQYLSSFEPVEVAFDGQYRFSLNPKEKFTICPASRRFRLVTVASFDYFATLRTKLNWTGSLRN
jgi:NAD+ kinase